MRGQDWLGDLSGKVFEPLREIIPPWGWDFWNGIGCRKMVALQCQGNYGTYRGLAHCKLETKTSWLSLLSFLLKF